MGIIQQKNKDIRILSNDILIIVPIMHFLQKFNMYNKIIPNQIFEFISKNYKTNRKINYYGWEKVSLEKEIKELIKTPEEEGIELVEVLRALKKIVTIYTDGRIMFKTRDLSVKIQVLLVLLSWYVLKRLNELIQNGKLSLGFEIPKVKDERLSLAEIVKLLGAKKGTVSSVLSKLLQSGLILRENGKYKVNVTKMGTILEVINDYKVE